MARIATILSALLLPPVLAASDFASCCLQVPLPASLQPFQKPACLGTYSPDLFSNTTASPLFPPPILTTLSWCRQNCRSTGITNIASTSQWLTPFTSWVIPALTMLFLCPITERLESRDTLLTRSLGRVLLDEFIFNWLHPIFSFIQILGDPASAFNGALTQMLTDAFLCASLRRPENSPRERSLIVTAILAEQTSIEDRIIHTTFQILAGLDKAREYSQQAGRTMLAARRKFNMSVTLPVGFYIGVAAALFHDAVQKLGDNDTAHALAYGVWLNWILLLSVFSNCFATHLSLEAVRSGLEVILRGLVENYTYAETECLGWDKSIGPSTPLYETAAAALFTTRPPPAISGTFNTATETLEDKQIIFPPRNLLFSSTLSIAALPLHRRFLNSRKWSKYLFDKNCDVCRPPKGVFSWVKVWVNHWERPRLARDYLVSQVFAWCFVAGTSLCAAYISYTTPSRGLGCRSLNHLLFALFTLFTAVLRVPLDLLSAKKYPKMLKVTGRVYVFLVGFNAVVLLAGGLYAQFTGVYKSCWCEAGMWGGMSGDTVMDLGVGGWEKVEAARRVWVGAGLVGYAGVMGCALGALGVRLYISYTIRAFLEV